LSFIIHTENVSKQFAGQLLYSGLNLTFESPVSYVILGANGSGKSTLIQMLLGFVAPSKGVVKYIHNGQNMEEENIYKLLSFAAPYLELPEELNAIELIEFHFSQRDKINETTTLEILEKVGLLSAKKKYIKYYSSGMKQRLKLALAFYTYSQVIMLDEPCTNLDDEGIKIYHHLIETLTLNRLVIVASNQIEEYKFCNRKLIVG
jgi:ABC-type multidrug transport system ATPase subunit